MPRRFPYHTRREQHIASPAFTRLLFLTMGIAVLIGLACGVVWVAYNLLRNWLA